MGNIIEIKDFEDKQLDFYARLSEVQLMKYNEPKDGYFIAESPIVVERALDAGYEPVSILIEDKDIEGAGKKIIERCGDIPVYTAKFDILTKLTGFKLTRGMLCLMKRRPLRSVEDVCKGARRIAVLENVVNPTNVGAIFRSAAALGMDAVILTKGCTNPLYRRAIRVSMGTVFQIPWTIMDDEIDWQKDGIDYIKKLGFATAAMALSDNSVSIDDKKLAKEEKIALVLGTEGEGLMKETIDNCDYTVKIPMAEGVDSLNVAAASAVAFWEILR